MYTLSKRSLDRMIGVHPKLISIAKRAIEITKTDFGIPDGGGLRSDLLQARYYNEGLSRCDGVLKKSYHQSDFKKYGDTYGRALDFYAYVDGKASYLEGDLAKVATAFLQAAIDLNLRIEWGGLWNYTDMPHIQLME